MKKILNNNRLRDFYMRVLIVLIFAGLLAAACSKKSDKSVKAVDTDCFAYSDKPVKAVDPDYFAYYVSFSPAFLQSSRISIIRENGKGLIKFTVFKFYENSTVVTNVYKGYPQIFFNDTTRKVRKIDYSDSTALSQADFKYFFTTLGNISLIKMESDSTFGFDGIAIFNICYQGKDKNVFFYWSPRKGSKGHKIVEAVIGLSRLKFTSKKYTEYFESLEQYFEFGLPCKKISENPFEVRIYGNLTSSNELELTKFIDDLPSDKPILIDMTNFGGMATMFYPLFNSLITRNKRVYWATAYNSQLIEIGVDTAKIANDIETARKWMKSKRP